MEPTEPTIITLTQEHLVSEYVVPATPTGKTVSDPQPVPIEDVGPQGALYTPWLCFDAAANAWSGEAVLDYQRFPQQQAVAVVTQTSPQGAQLGQWALIPAQDQNGNWQKADGTCGAQSGGTMIVDITTHALAAGDQRYIRRYRVGIPGAVPPAAQIAPAGGYVPDQPPAPPPGPPPADVDYARIQGMINVAAQHVVDNIKTKADAAITEAQVLTYGNVHESTGLFQRLRETIGEQLQKAFEGADDYTKITQAMLIADMVTAIKQASAPTPEATAPPTQEAATAPAAQEPSIAELTTVHVAPPPEGEASGGGDGGKQA